jgi:hypothetical protein
MNCGSPTGRNHRPPVLYPLVQVVFIVVLAPNPVGKRGLALK